jgi:TonB-linked SusC/RagA family outer membrane protein
MKNKPKPDILLIPQNVKKIFLMMKISLFLILVSAINLHAGNVFSQNGQMTGDKQNVTARESALNQADMVFEEIKDDFLVLLSGQANSNIQQIDVSGTVTDSQTGNTIPGVSIVVEGTTTGTITDANGRYSLTVPNKDAVLRFSYVGYEARTVPVEGRTIIDTALIPDLLALDEVVVTALGITREARSIGYAVEVVDQRAITEVRTSNPFGTLQGKVSGLNISSPSTGPGSSTRIRIRGESSFTGDNRPLIVVDGVPFDNSRFGSVGGFANYDTGDGLLSINPDDILSMTVLKGAGAAALYGNRAKDGVIMITTKQRGQRAGFEVTYNINHTVETAIDNTNFQYEYGQGEQGIRPTTPWPASGVWSFGEKIEPGMTQILFDNREVPYVAIRDRLNQFYRPGSNSTNTITLSNNTDIGGFNLSLSNTDSRSIVENSGFNRKNITLGFTQQVYQGLRVNGNINYSNEYHQNIQNVGGQDINHASAVMTMANTMPWDLLEEYHKDEFGNEILYARFLPRSNPYWTIYETFSNQTRDRIFGNITLRYDLTDAIFIQGRIGQDYYMRKLDYNNPTGTASIPAAPAGYVNGRYFMRNDEFRERNYDFLIGAHRDFGDFGINTNFGGNQMFRSVKNEQQSAIDFVERGLYTIMNGRERSSSHDLNERAVNSLYGVVDLSFRNYLFLTMTGRNDWFSTLAPEHRSIFYPSITSSFVFSDAVNMPGWLSFGKLRLSYAEVGDDNVAPYSNVMYYSVGAQLFPSDVGNVPVGNFGSNTIPNPNLKPMRVEEWEVGADFRLFNNTVGFDIAYYHKITKNQIVSSVTSFTTGFGAELINVGESLSEGIETSLKLAPVRTASFSWDMSANVSYNTSEVLRLGLTEADTMITVAGTRMIVGRKIGQLYAFEQAVDDQGRKVFDASGNPVRGPEEVNYGTNRPSWFGGINNTFNIKGVTLSALIDFRLGNDYYLAGGPNRHYWRHGLHRGTLPGREANAVVGEGVGPDGQPNTVAAPLQPYYERYHALGIFDYWRAKAGFWKLRQVTVGYDFTRFMTNVPYIQGVRLNLVANNVAILKKWVENMDPEEATYGDIGQGTGFSAMPTARSIGFNLNVSF